MSLVAHCRARAAERGCGEPERPWAPGWPPPPLAAGGAAALRPDARANAGFRSGGSVWRGAWWAAGVGTGLAKAGPFLASFCSLSGFAKAGPSPRLLHEAPLARLAAGTCGSAPVVTVRVCDSYLAQAGLGSSPIGPSLRLLHDAPFARLAAGTCGMVNCGSSVRHSCVFSSTFARKASSSGPSCTSVSEMPKAAASRRMPGTSSRLPASGRPLPQPFRCRTQSESARSA